MYQQPWCMGHPLLTLQRRRVDNLRLLQDRQSMPLTSPESLTQLQESLRLPILKDLHPRITQRRPLKTPINTQPNALRYVQLIHGFAFLLLPINIIHIIILTPII